MNYVFIDNFLQKNKIINILINKNILLYLLIHIKLSTVFYSTQLVDLLSYELPNSFFTNKKKLDNINKTQSNVLIYNFHSISNEVHFFVFIQNNNQYLKSTKLNNNDSIETITELYKSSNWLEREVSELHSINFFGKKDLRNLMLQYGDSSGPFKKSFPSVGLKEIYYNSIKDTLVQNNITLQL